jgi:hypothetical protein
MGRVAIIARLKEGSEQRAAELVGAEPRASEAVFVFEGHEVEWIVDQLIDEPFHYERQRPLEQSRESVDEQSRVARGRFDWQLDVAAPGTARAGQRSESWA